MTISITRRDSLILGAAEQDAPATDVPMAAVPPPQFAIEKGASLHTVRPAKFIDPDQKWWDINTKKFTDTTGIPVAVNDISREDLRPREPLKAYAKMKFWTGDPKPAPYANAMDTIYYDGYAGPVSAAASPVVANYTVVDMFASVAAGNSTPEQAAKAAAKQAARYYVKA